MKTQTIMNAHAQNLLQRDIVLIDNFDSFTYNLVDEFSRLDQSLQVRRNTLSVRALNDILKSLKRPLLVLSPGPGTPESAGFCLDYLHQFLGRYPILGICLGHQALVTACGGYIERAPRAVHGERSRVHHTNHVIFSGLPPTFLVGRYHSLVAQKMPDALQTIAHADGLCMAVSHRDFPAIGLQFHPESILTTYGSQLLANILHYFDQEKCDAALA